MSNVNVKTAVELMDRFATRTGLTSKRPPQRYLWTDAFAVCNFLGFAKTTGDARYTRLAQQLIDQVHITLGRHRHDDSRTGWISGLDNTTGREHPTRGGLRIGKPLPERGPGEPFNEQLEWERDGQYFHYLTRWMHALDQTSRATRDPIFNLWGRELAVTAHSRFVYTASDGDERMYWKMSIDLSRPLVPSMGLHDPLDGYVTYSELAATASQLPDKKLQPELAAAVKSFASMLNGRDLTTADPLGIGGLLMDAYLAQQLMAEGPKLNDRLVEQLLGAALKGLDSFAADAELSLPASQRLAFRELGLAIGLSAVPLMQRATGPAPEQLDKLSKYEPLSENILSFWLSDEHRRASTWSEHLDINEVMLATALAPEGCLVLGSGE